MTRMAMTIPLLVALLGFIAAGPRAAAQVVVADASAHEIKLEYSFAGSSVVVFGAVDHLGPNPEAEPIGVVIRLKGPPETLILRKKERILGLWINRTSETLKDVPGYLAITSSPGLEKMPLPEDMLLADLQREAAASTPDLADDYLAALYRLKTGETLYSARPGEVTILSNTLFSAEFTLPANTPVGEYVAEVFVVEDGAVVAREATVIAVRKAGLELSVANLAHQHSLAYGLMAVMLALLAGWLAGLLSRREGK